jgi:hypothetical protein
VTTHPEIGERLAEAEVLASSPLAGPVAELGVPAPEWLAAEVERALEHHTDDEGLLLAMQTWLVEARRDARSG